MLRSIAGVPGRPGGRIGLSPCLHGGNQEDEAKEDEAVHGCSVGVWRRADLENVKLESNCS